jgi:hypothetical protein
LIFSGEKIVFETLPRNNFLSSFLLTLKGFSIFLVSQYRYANSNAASQTWQITLGKTQANFNVKG